MDKAIKDELEKSQARDTARARNEFAKAQIKAPLDPVKIGLTFGELQDMDLPKREEIIKGLARCEIGLINAVTNVGKSTLIRILTLCLIIGRLFDPLINHTKRMRVAIIDSEDTLVFLRADLNKMIASFTDHEKQLVKENLLLICDQLIADEPIRINKKDHFNLLVSALNEFKPDIIFIDTISQSFVISNENDNSEVKERVMKPLKRLATLVNSAVLAAHHIGKAKAEEGSTREGSHRGRGASAFADQSRVIFNLEKGSDQNVILSCPKLKGDKFTDTIFSYDSETRWLSKQGVSRILTNYENVLEALEYGKSYKRNELGEIFESEMSRATLNRVLSDAVSNGDLLRDKGAYSKRLKGSSL